MWLTRYESWLCEKKYNAATYPSMLVPVHVYLRVYSIIMILGISDRPLTWTPGLLPAPSIVTYPARLHSSSQLTRNIRQSRAKNGKPVYRDKILEGYLSILFQQYSHVELFLSTGACNVSM